METSSEKEVAEEAAVTEAATDFTAGTTTHLESLGFLVPPVGKIGTVRS